MPTFLPNLRLIRPISLRFGLHPTAGVLTAQKSGVYVFTWTINVCNNGVYCVELVVNGQVVEALF